MTIYEILGIEEYLIDMPIPQDMILANIQYSSVSGNVETYFSVINNIILRASIQREDLELQILEISLNEPRYIQEISYLIQTAIKYRVLFVFSFDDRYLIVRRTFRLTESTDHVYSKNLSYTTEWIYQENLIADILCGYQSNDIADDFDEDEESIDYWEAIGSKNRFYKVFHDILENIGQLNQCMIDCKVLSLRQFIDWYAGHSVKDRLEFLSIAGTVIYNNGMQFIEDTMFFEKNTIIYAIAELENSNYLRSVNYFSRHPFSYFDSISTLDVHAIENQIFHILASEKNEEFKNNSPQKACEKYIDNTIKNYFDTVDSYPLLKKEDEIRLLFAMQKGDKKAKDLLIKSNLRLVVSIAKRYLNNGLPLDDLIQEGTLGLIKAIEKHDISYDTRISTYATYWIEQAIQRALMDQVYLIRIPVHLTENIEKIRKAEKKLEYECGDDPTIEEIANYLQMSVNKVEEIQKISTTILSLDNIVNEFGDTEIKDVVDVENPTIIECLYQIDLNNTLETVLKTLTPREEQIIRLRFGLEDGYQRTLEEVGQMFNLSRENVRLIEAKALRKMRHPSRSKLLRNYIHNGEAIKDSFVGFVKEDYSTPQYSYLDDMIRRWHLRGWNIIEEANLAHSIVQKLRKMGYQVLEELKNIKWCAFNNFTISEKIELLYYLDSIGMRIRGCSEEEYPSIDDFLKETIRCVECGGSLNEEDWTIEKRVCNCCKQRLNRIRGEKEFEIRGESARYRDEISNSFRFKAYIRDNFNNYRRDDFSITSIFLMTSEKEALACNEYVISEDTISTNCSSLLAKWRWISDEFDFENVKFIYLSFYNKRNQKNSLFVYSLVETNECEDEQIFNVPLYDFKDTIDYSKEIAPYNPTKSNRLLFLPNIGEALFRRLRFIGIRTSFDLIQTSTEEIWDRLYADDSHTNYIEIYSIEGAKQGVLYTDLEPKRRDELKQYVDIRKGMSIDPESLTTLPNIGPVLSEKLKKIGIDNVTALKSKTTEEIWDKLFQSEISSTYSEICSIEGAKQGVKVISLTDARKLELKSYVNEKKGIAVDSEDLTALPNIGSVLAEKLKKVGIDSMMIKEETTEKIWDKLFQGYPSTHYAEIYSIEGACCGKKISELELKRKNELKEYVDKKKGKITANPEDLTTLPNIGKAMSDRLMVIGINTVSELDSIRTEDVWDKLFQVNSATDIAEIHLIECAKQRIKTGTLPELRKDELKQYVRTRKSILGIGETTKFNFEESTRIAEEKRKAEEAARLAEEKRRAEEAARLVEEKRKAEEVARLAEEKRRAEEAARLAEEKRKAEEAARLAEEKRKAEEATRLAEEKRKAEEAARLAEEKRRAEEAARLAEEKRKAEEAARLAEEKRKAEEVARLAEEKRRAEEAARLAEEKRKAEETARLAEEKRRAEEAARLAEEKCKAEEAARLAEEKRKAEEAARLAEEKRKAEEVARLTEEKRRAEEVARIAEEKRKAEEAARLAEKKRKAEEANQLAEERYKDQRYSLCFSIYNTCSDIYELTNVMESLENLGDWKQSKQLIGLIRNKIASIAEEQQKMTYRSLKVCQYCGGNFKGLFIKKCCKCGRKKDY